MSHTNYFAFSALNKENILRSDADIEYHPLYPFLPEDCKVLFLGSFPPQRKRWCMDFYYPNYINDHWRIAGIIFFGNTDVDFYKQKDIEEKCGMLSLSIKQTKNKR